MLNNYSLSNAFTRLENELDEAQQQKKAWEKVKIVTKKDGSPFKNFSKNFEGCKTYLKSYASWDFEKEITVYYQTKRGGYRNASLDCYKTIENNEEVEHPENICLRGPGWKRGYTFTVEEMKQQIKNRIEYLENRIATLEDAIDNFNIVSDLMADICQKVEALENRNKSLYYEARKILRES